MNRIAPIIEMIDRENKCNYYPIAVGDLDSDLVSLKNNKVFELNKQEEKYILNFLNGELENIYKIFYLLSIVDHISNDLFQKLIEYRLHLGPTLIHNTISHLNRIKGFEVVEKEIQEIFKKTSSLTRKMTCICILIDNLPHLENWQWDIDNNFTAEAFSTFKFVNNKYIKEFHLINKSHSNYLNEVSQLLLKRYEMVTKFISTNNENKKLGLDASLALPRNLKFSNNEIQELYEKTINLIEDWAQQHV